MVPTPRVLVLAVCWVVYAYFPVHFGLFNASRLGYLPFWEEILLHALAVFGYGTFGCWLFALTGRQGKGRDGGRLPSPFERMGMATGVSLLFFVLFLMVDYS